MQIHIKIKFSQNIFVNNRPSLIQTSLSASKCCTVEINQFWYNHHHIINKWMTCTCTQTIMYCTTVHVNILNICWWWWCYKFIYWIEGEERDADISGEILIVKFVMNAIAISFLLIAINQTLGQEVIIPRKLLSSYLLMRWHYRFSHFFWKLKRRNG